MPPAGRACDKIFSLIRGLLQAILTPSSEPDLSLLAKGAFGAAGAFGLLSAPGPAGGACSGGLEGPVRELREPLALVLALVLTLAPPLGGGD